MSSGDKKPGMRDISDLKARLGMLNKNVGGGSPAPAEPAGESPFSGSAPMTEPAVNLEDAAGGDAPGGDDPNMDTVVHRLPEAEQAAAEAADAEAAAPSSRPTVQPGATGVSPFQVGSAADLFKKEEPKPEPEPAPAAPVAAQRAASAPPQPAAPVVDNRPGAQFAHPMQGGQAFEAAAPVDLSVAEQEALDSFEKGERGVKKGAAIAAVAAIGVLALGMGFGLGSSMGDRKILNRATLNAGELKGMFDPLSKQVSGLDAIVMPLDPNKVVWPAIENIPEDLQDVNAQMIFERLGQAPMPSNLTKNVAVSVDKINQLFRAARELRTGTLIEDKAELKDLEEGGWWSKQEFFAALYKPVDPKTPPLRYIPPAAKIVAVVGKPSQSEAGKFFEIPIKYRDGKEKVVPVQEILRLDKGQVVQGSKSNALTRYTERVNKVKGLIKEVRPALEQVQKLLADEAGRSLYFTL